MRNYEQLVARYLPEPTTLTKAEYLRLLAASPPPVARAEPRTLVCPACGTRFQPHWMAGRPRFCQPDCRRWFHYGAGARTRKGVAA